MACSVLDDNPTTAVDDDGQPITWKDLGQYDENDVMKASEYLTDFLRKSFFPRAKGQVQVGLLKPGL